ncbi:MAG: hypothetical protein OSB36_06355 [Longimicrobiales bacterium]|nr:hypothetical protein [Longimicrobiales bacterium]
MNSPEADWATRAQPYDDIDRIAGPPPPWEIDKGDIELMASDSVAKAEIKRLRRLQRGGILPDGSHLCWADGRFSLDGITVEIPYRGLSKLLKRKRGLEDVDWKKLLLSVSLANKRFRSPHDHRNRRVGRETTIHPVALIRVDVKTAMDAYRFGYLGMGRRRGPVGLDYNQIWFEGASWMDGWRNNRQVSNGNIDDMVVPTALFIKNGRLQLRVRRPGGWRRLEIESHPEVWAKVVTWALSPPDSKHHERLRCVQQGLFSDSGIEMISKPDRNGIQMLRGVIADNENVVLGTSPSTAGGFIVKGSSGAMYRVTPGAGGHNTRFVVRGIGHPPADDERGGIPPWMRGDRPPICVVETPQLRMLVIGDALSSVILALLDDLKSQQHIDTLRSHIREFRPRQAVDPHVAEFHQAERLRFRLRNNLAEDRTRRYTELFPRLWGVLLRLPLGERVIFTAIRRDRPNITFDGCDCEFATRDMLERRVIYRMLEAAGWQRDRHEEQVRGYQRIYIRTGTGPQNLANLVEGFAEMLETVLTVNERVRLVANPAWTFFERNNPGIGALLPGTNERLN